MMYFQQNFGLITDIKRAKNTKVKGAGGNLKVKGIGTIK